MNLQTFGSSLIARITSWMRAVVHRGPLEEEMEAELTHHIESLTADLIRQGQAPNEAVRNARIALGAVAVQKEQMRSSLGLRWWDELRADLRYGIRILLKSPGFTLIAATSLSLAIGANTTIFSVAKQMLYDRLDVPHAADLRLLRTVSDENSAIHRVWGFTDKQGGSYFNTSFTYPIYQGLRAQNQTMQDLFAFKDDTLNATVRGEAQRVQVEMVSGNYYEALGVRPQLGRGLQPSDDTMPGTGTVAVISESLWKRKFGWSPSVLGQSIKVSDATVTIVGVNPEGFTGAGSVQISPDVFLPISMQPLVHPINMTAAHVRDGSLLADTHTWWLNIMGRAKPGIKDSAAQAALDVQLNAAVRGTMDLKPGDTIPHLELADGSRGLYASARTYKKPMQVLVALSGLVMLLACANIANLLLARGAKRQREMSVRLALGAGRARLLRQLLTESLLLAALGGAGGLLLGYFGRNTIPILMTKSWEWGDISIPFDWRVFGFTAVVTLATGILFGIAPAWLAARVEVGGSLKDTAQTTTRKRKGFSAKTLVGFQIALSTLLVVGAGLFLRTLAALNSVDPGFRTEHLVLFGVNPPSNRYPPGKDVELHERLEQAFTRQPGVEAVAPMSVPYLEGGGMTFDFLPEGESADKNKHQSEFADWVGLNFFPGMGIPVVAGRGFNSQDTETAPKVAVINASLARKRFPNVNPIGKRFKLTYGINPGWIEIVGICADTHYRDLRSDAPPQFFLPYVQRPDVGGMTFALRTRLATAELAPMVRAVVQQMDRDLPVVNLRTEEEQIDANMQMERAFAALTTGFGVLALALACVGIYGIMAYSVANRRNEIGIRLALGALPGQVRRMILRESTGLALAGIVVGVAAALGLTRLVKSMLYGIEPWDPATMAGGVLILLAVALAASWIPARRAAGVQPMDALRHE